jgi:hypothetical protein
LNHPPDPRHKKADWKYAEAISDRHRCCREQSARETGRGKNQCGIRRTSPRSWKEDQPLATKSLSLTNGDFQNSCSVTHTTVSSKWNKKEAFAPDEGSIGTTHDNDSRRNYWDPAAIRHRDEFALSYAGTKHPLVVLAGQTNPSWKKFILFGWVSLHHRKPRSAHGCFHEGLFDSS